ncbi:GNAT family N-acetyltransferase [Collimonas humicola]|uniref:GNAT family N-acetyltransferase n=1 Tax=Collimonas humicola TaxID=2825886 RepID=UPI001B8BB675|nr:GNAT family N-acetyltransferase [Collimonas humicola]
MNHMNALGVESELFFHRLNGNVKKWGKYTLIYTKNCPDSYSGNSLLLENKPDIKNFYLFEADFASLIGKPPEIQHRSFIWPMSIAENSDASEFTHLGYEYSENLVLLAKKNDLIRPTKSKIQIEIKPYSSNEDWQKWEAMLLQDNAFPANAYRCYLECQRHMYQSLIRHDQGNWWGAYIDGEQVANLGLFFDGEIGRFQSVLTDPSFRNQGICKALVHHVAVQGFSKVSALLMVAEGSHHALQLYQSLGFKAVEKYASLLWLPKASID